ncbi:MAG: hypothetical protein QGH25_05765 [Candidatus Latescibacteria bacterium]|nr:hypothetical protein [Candidatus Latescibacterota bacterium]
MRQNLLERLYANWNPAWVTRRSAALERDLEVLKIWGRAMQPVHPDALPVPDVEDVVRC